MDRIGLTHSLRLRVFVGGLLYAAGDHAGPPLRRIARHGERGSDDRLLGQHEREQQGRHCLGNTKRPPVPVIRLAWMFLKSGSEVKPVPLRCCVGESKVKSRSELT